MGAMVHEAIGRRLDAVLGPREAEGRWSIGRSGWIELECRGGVLFARVYVRSAPKLALALNSRGAVRAFRAHVRMAWRLETISRSLHCVC